MKGKNLPIYLGRAKSVLKCPVELFDNSTLRRTSCGCLCSGEKLIIDGRDERQGGIRVSRYRGSYVLKSPDESNNDC